MLTNLKDIYGTRLAATDGNIGHVKDFYFDDDSWNVCYLVVDTGSWLPGRQVLLTPQVFDGFGRQSEVLMVGLSKEQIESSPPIENHLPVTRRHESDFNQYYGWPAYWEGSGTWCSGGQQSLSASQMEQFSGRARDPMDDARLRSTRAVAGYEIKASDGVLGMVADFRVDHKSWAIGDLVVETGHWYAGKQIRISPAAIKSVSHHKMSLSVKLTRAEIHRTREDELARVAFVNR